MKRLEIMTDIETMGHLTNSTIIQIAAIAFDMDTGEHIAEFNQIADISENKTMNVTGATIKWWLDTNKHLFHMLLNDGEGSSEELLIAFRNWLLDLSHGHDIYLWGNGILFDNKMIQYQLEAMDLSYPISYKNDRDVRTIVDLASQKLGITSNKLKAMYNDDTLTAHDAFDDVKYQINYVRACHQILLATIK